ncbi:MAG: family 10 glycosylhydrolase [Lachnospiraceae bacterium]|nr:family 10 glycosylhydrolase [Lachnospiraceae bacterium]
MKINKIFIKKRLRHVSAISGAIALILVCALAVSHLFPDSVSKNKAPVAQGKTTVKKTKFTPAKGEFRGVWISFQEFGTKAYSYQSYKNFIDKTFDNCKDKGFNAVVMHVRPFSDAIYPSSYYPWSKYISGQAGKNPGFDPLAYAVDAAHKRGLAFHAWINPYRVTNDYASFSKLPASSITRKWATSSKASKRRNVIKWQGKVYLNPASTDVRNLVTKGVKEIVKKYPVDGIHFDDYFYPNLGTKYKKVFDSKEYKTYVKKCKKAHKTPMSIIKWRRNNVTKLMKRIYKAVHKLDKNCVFGISPAGNISNLYAKNNYYADVKKWMKTSGYIDYICPQVYWSFTQKICPFRGTVNKWLSLPRSSKVKLYVGLAGYRAGISKKAAKSLYDPEWGTSRTNLKRQLEYLRTKDNCNGFVLFSYADLNRSSAKKEMNKFLALLEE